MSVHVIGHPLVLHKLSIMRDKNTSTSKFRQSLQEVSMLMGYEITRGVEIVWETELMRHFTVKLRKLQ